MIKHVINAILIVKLVQVDLLVKHVKVGFIKIMMVIVYLVQLNV